MDRYKDRLITLVTSHLGRSFGPQFCSEVYAGILETNGLGFRIEERDVVAPLEADGMLAEAHSFSEEFGRTILVIGPYLLEGVHDRHSVEDVPGDLGEAVPAAAPADPGPSDGQSKPRRIPGQPRRRVRETAPLPPVTANDLIRDLASRPPDLVIAGPLEVRPFTAGTAKPIAEGTKIAARTIPGQPGRRVRHPKAE